jgi:hypothetical protein
VDSEDQKERAVPLSKKLVGCLSAHVPGKVWLCPSPEGHRWDPDNLSRRFRKLLMRAELPWNLLDSRHTRSGRNWR